MLSKRVERVVEQIQELENKRLAKEEEHKEKLKLKMEAIDAEAKCMNEKLDIEREIVIASKSLSDIFASEFENRK